ncbi:alpha-tocopherol transfer protein-like [Saccoglossus kowalevskii]|uniref:Alpha-tocopherol transfer protein-like n=1 Tax=Saccoglossus kowalevskii TaxID=10224 RepID=A0ABM0GNW5_SACKO|nr:PREDICTED: alpha-tocopherol transfer protein-like [Saccoglossus kowalevskii]
MSDTNKPYVCTLSKELQEKAKKELHETPEGREQGLKALREKTHTRPDIKFRTDDAFLLRFLRARKFDVNRAFKNLVAYYEIRHEYPEVFDNLEVDKLKYIWEEGLDGMFPGKDSEGRRVGVFRPGKLDVDKYSVKDMARASVLTIEKMLEDEESQITGVVMIGDFADYTAKHALHNGPSFAKLMMSITESAMPIRNKGVHFVNTPSIFEAGMAIWSVFMTEKMKKRIRVHGDEYGTLHKYIPSANLPSDYGGTQPSVTECTTKWMKELQTWETKYIAENDKYGIPKMKDALGKDAKTIDPSGGLVGSFKKIEL